MGPGEEAGPAHAALQPIVQQLGAELTFSQLSIPNPQLPPYPVGVAAPPPAGAGNDRVVAVEEADDDAAGDGEVGDEAPNLPPLPPSPGDARNFMNGMP